MLRTGVILTGLLVALAVASPVASADVSFQVKGKWTCSNRGTVIPIAGARVELWRERSFWFDDKLGARHTAGDGSFDFGVRAGSNFDLYAKLVLNDDSGVKLSNWYSFLGTEWNVNTSKTRSQSGVVNLGTWQVSRGQRGGDAEMRDLARGPERVSQL